MTEEEKVTIVAAVTAAEEEARDGLVALGRKEGLEPAGVRDDLEALRAREAAVERNEREAAETPARVARERALCPDCHGRRSAAPAQKNCPICKGTGFDLRQPEGSRAAMAAEAGKSMPRPEELGLPAIGPRGSGWVAKALRSGFEATFHDRASAIGWLGLEGGGRIVSVPEEGLADFRGTAVAPILGGPASDAERVRMVGGRVARTPVVPPDTPEAVRARIGVQVALETTPGFPNVRAAKAPVVPTHDPTRNATRVPMKVGIHQSLSGVLAALGWRHERPGSEYSLAVRGNGRRVLYRDDGTPAGLYDVEEAWRMLFANGYIASAGDDTP